MKEILKRLGKVIYVLAIVVIVVLGLISLAKSIEADANQYIKYKVKCISNDQYVVLQGNHFDDHVVVTKGYLSNPLNFEPDPNTNYNFYCKHYTEVQEYIKKYLETDDIVAANIEYFEFKNSMLPFVSSYPKLYTLEPTDNREFIYSGVINSIIDTMVYVLGLFMLLQLLKIIYIYVIFGELVLHPFRMKKRKK